MSDYQVPEQVTQTVNDIQAMPIWNQLLSGEYSWAVLLIAGFVLYLILKLVMTTVKAVLLAGFLIVAISMFFPELHVLEYVNQFLDVLRGYGIPIPHTTTLK